MSQYIRKMNSGGPVESQEQERNRMNVFETASGEYDAKALAANFENNIDDYVNYIGIQKDSKDYQRFIDQAARIQKGIVDGTFKRVEGLKYEGSIISDGNKFQRLATRKQMITLTLHLNSMTRQDCVSSFTIISLVGKKHQNLIPGLTLTLKSRMVQDRTLIGRSVLPR